MGNCCIIARRRNSDIGLMADVDDPISTPELEQVHGSGNVWDNVVENRNPTLTNPLLYLITPGTGYHIEDLSEEDQVQIAKRLGLISHLPLHVHVEGESNKNAECVICMVEYVEGDSLRCLPCTHTYHKDCIDDWLMRSFACPSCNQAVDSALVTTFSPPDA